MKALGALTLAIAVGLSGTAAHASARVLKLEELTYTDIDQLDRGRTVFFLTFGNLEEHGPHLPVGSDFFQASALRDGVIQSLSATHPDDTFVIAPVVPLGEGGANDIAGQLEHVGTFGVRFETLRNVAVDLGSAVARQGFRKIILVHFHGMPLHSIAFSDASAYVSQRYDVRMVDLTSLVFGEGFYSESVLEKHLGKRWQEKTGAMESHAGAAETSTNLAIRPQLVKKEYKRLTPFKAGDFDEFLRTYQNLAGWRGYWGGPAEASVALGKDLMRDFVRRSARIAEMALRGEDLSKLPVFPNALPASAEGDALVKKSLDSYAERTADFEAWLKTREAEK